MTERLSGEVAQHTLRLPPQEGRLRSRFYQLQAIEKEWMEEDGSVSLQVRMPIVDWRRLCKQEPALIEYVIQTRSHSGRIEAVAERISGAHNEVTRVKSRHSRRSLKDDVCNGGSSEAWSNFALSSEVERQRGSPHNKYGAQTWRGISPVITDRTATRGEAANPQQLWGNGNKGGRDQGPPDLDDIFRKLSKNSVVLGR